MMIVNTSLEIIRCAYHKSDFWAKPAKHLYPLISIFHPTLDWPAIITKFMKEFNDVEENYSSLLKITGETCVEFFCRLSSALKQLHKISVTEEELLLAFFVRNSAIPTPTNFYAQALIFKACLEIGRLRPDPIEINSIIEFAREVRTVAPLFYYPLELPLPIVADVDKIPMNPHEFSIFSSAIRSTADYHLAASFRLADFDYHRAVGEIARQYLNFDSAYNSLRNKNDLSSCESVFVEKYERIRNFMA
jgi:hypothetical protein